MTELCQDPSYSLHTFSVITITWFFLNMPQKVSSRKTAVFSVRWVSHCVTSLLKRTTNNNKSPNRNNTPSSQAQKHSNLTHPSCLGPAQQHERPGQGKLAAQAGVLLIPAPPITGAAALRRGERAVEGTGAFPGLRLRLPDERFTAAGARPRQHQGQAPRPGARFSWYWPRRSAGRAAVSAPRPVWSAVARSPFLRGVSGGGA